MHENQETRSLVSKKVSVTRIRKSSVSASLSIDPKITLMVLAVVLAFFCCQFPYLLLYLLRDPKAKQESFNFKLAKTICDFLAAFNCCINFLIYCFFGQNFRNIAKTMLFHPSLTPYSRATLHRNAYNLSLKQQSLIKKKTDSMKLDRIQTIEEK